MDGVMDGGLDRVIVGGGRRGLLAALAGRRAAPEARLLVVEQAVQPGGSVRTLRSNGFVCELGPFAFRRDEVEPVLALLDRPPSLIPALPQAVDGWIFTGSALERTPVEPAPWSFAAGNEDLAQACRRDLGPRLQLGRAVTAVRATQNGYELDLGGEVMATLRARELTLAVPVAVAAHLLAALDPALGNAAARLHHEPRAFVFFGGHAADCPELRGYGAVPAPGLPTPLAEMIFCSNVFPRRALPGRLLVRCEVAGQMLEGDDAAVLAATERELRRWTGCRGPLPFTKVFRFAAPAADAASVECRARLLGLGARASGLTFAADVRPGAGGRA